MNCEQAVRRLWDYLDGRLPSFTREEVEAHLDLCLRCPPHFTFAQSVKEWLRHAGTQRENEVTDRDGTLRERVRSALRSVSP